MLRKILAVWVVTASLPRLFLKQAINQRSQCWLFILPVFSLMDYSSLHPMTSSCKDSHPSKENQDLGDNVKPLPRTFDVSKDSPTKTRKPWWTCGFLVEVEGTGDRLWIFHSLICQSHHESGIWYSKGGAPTQPIQITSRRASGFQAETLEDLAASWESSTGLYW